MQAYTIQGIALARQQRRLWQVQPVATPLLTQAAVLLEGPLDTARLRAAVEQVVARHESLRTTFHRLAGLKLPLQTIADVPQLIWREQPRPELAQLSLTDAVERVLAETADAPVDLEQGPLLRLTLAALAPARALLVVTLPALIADAHSLHNLFAELSQRYAGRPAPDGIADDELTQYADYAAWQEQVLQDDDNAEGLAFWHKRCAMLPPRPALPYERLQTTPSRLPARLTMVIPPHTLQAAAALAETAEYSLEAVLLAAWQSVLWRFTGSAEQVIGVTLSGRGYEELAPTIGLLSRTVPVPARLRPDLRFDQLLHELVTDLQTAETWQDAFTDEHLLAATDLRVGFRYERRPASYTADDLRLSIFDLRSLGESTLLQLVVVDSEDQLAVELHYDSGSLDEQLVSQLARSFATLLNAAIAAPEQTLADLELVSAEDQQELRDVRPTPLTMPATTIVAAFEAQVARTPQAAAVSCAGQTLSYTELNARANQLAHRLRQLGVGADMPVAIAVERSAEMIVGLLGVMKAGGGYVPLDPDLPQARLTYQLEQCGATVLLTDADVHERLPLFAGARIDLDHDQAELASQPEHNPAALATPERLAYIIFTSGSTGQPKGVCITHANLLSYSAAICQRLGLDQPQAPPLHFATVSTISADLGNTAIFPALISGGCVHVLRYETVTDGDALARYMAAHPIDVLKIVPSHLSALLQSHAQADLLPRRWLILGGEAFSWALLDRLRQLQPSCAIINHYGPTEATIGALTYLLGDERSVREIAATVPIGVPLANASALVLDEQQRPVPLGVPGELYLGGAGVARGYLLAEQTAERFVAHVADGETTRLYRTGDLVRRLPDGAIEFLGRIDGQIKLRGYRIELGEIEATLRQLEGVLDAVVVARDDDGGERRLVAYVVAQVESGADAAAQAALTNQLRAALAERLPEYMLPTVIVLLPQLPLTANGKVDRQALPAPEHLASAQQYVAPRTQVEQLLASIWRQLLAAERIGIHDDFFVLGGHSLLVTQVMSRVRAVFEVDLPLHVFFDAPTIAQLAARIEEARRSAAGLSTPPLVPVSRHQRLPLSFSQQRFWFIEQLAEESLYNLMPLVALRLRGDLDIAVLTRTIEALVQRHETLRTTFALEAGQPVQIIAEQIGLPLDMVDLSTLPPAEHDAEVQRRATAEARRTFDLARGPLFRVTLLRLAERDHALLLAQHHIVSDGWSMGVLIREFSLLYDAFARGLPAPLAPLPVQYADYAFWQRSWFQGEVVERQLAYWQQQLADAPTMLLLPTDHSRPAEQSFNGANELMQLPEELAQALKALSQREGVTLFMTLLSAFGVLLYQYSSQDDIVIGTPIANRHRIETEGLIGVLINTLALRLSLQDRPSFRELVQRARAVTLGAYDHQDLPFEQLVDSLKLDRALSHNPLFQVLFVFNEEHAPATPSQLARQTLELPGLRWTPIEVGIQTARYDLALISEDSEGRSWSLEYNTDLFERATVVRMLDHFQQILAGIAADPEQRVDALTLVSLAEQRALLSGPRLPQPPGLVHEWIAAQAERAPDVAAVRFGAETLSYHELDQRANMLAHHLRGLGIGPEQCVAVCLERSLDLVVALLGVLKAGAAYLPIDPSYPAERIDFMLQDARAAALVTQTSLMFVLPPHETTIFLNELELSGPLAAPEVSPGAEQLAYVIYTSGSTGQPKGVMVSHANLAHSTHARSIFYPEQPGSFLLLSSFAFDSSVAGLFWTLTQGGTLELPPEDAEHDPAQIVELLHAARVSHTLCVPSLYQLLLEQMRQRQPEALRTVIVAGEACPPALVQTHHAVLPQTVLYNEYGPTEGSVWSTAQELRPEDSDSSVAIGRAISNVQLSVLNEDQQPVAVGVAGELYIGGAGVARGYLGRPELTAQRFVPDPLSPASKLYRTGDRVRYRDDGTLLFLGRSDDQIKLRGYRIELGEIEAALSAHPAVESAVAIVRADSSGEARLVAYVIPSDQALPNQSALRRYLAEQLPEYMLPSSFVTLSAWPLSPNGKINRDALPAPDGVRPELDAAYVAPQAEVEQVLARIWAEVLGLHQVGVHDNFFELGGDSILSMQIVVQAQASGLRITPKQMFQHQTISELALVAEPVTGSAIEQGPVVGPVLLTPIQHWFFEQDLPQLQYWNQSVMLEVHAALEIALLERVVVALETHHDALRLRFSQTASGWQQESLPPHDQAAVTRVDLSDLPGPERLAALETAAAEWQARLDLGQGPLLHAVWFDLGPDMPDRLLLVAHHLVVDGVSWRVLLDDLQQAYQQGLRGETIQLPAKTTAYQTWAEQLALYSQSSALLAEQHYWQSAVPATLPPLPIDHDTGANTVASGQTLSVSLSQDETIALVQEAPRAYHTQINELLLTALARALAGWTGQPQLLVDLEGHGREEIVEGLDLSRTVGWFTSVFPVCLQLDPVTDDGLAIKTIKEQLRAVPQRGIGYGVLRYLSPTPEVSAALRAQPQAEITFNYLGRFDQADEQTSPFRLAADEIGPQQSPDGQRRYLLDIEGSVVSGELRMDWTYSTARHTSATIQRLADRFIDELRALIAHCQSSEAGGYTPADFPDIGLAQQELDDVIGSVEFEQ